MKKVEINDLKPGLVKGIEVYMPDTAEPYKEQYFEWTASGIIAKFNSSEIGAGFLKTWHFAPCFDKIETHVDSEMFNFVSGTALMMFIDLKNALPDMDTAQIVRISPGTQILIHPGKGHFVAVAEDSTPVCAIVISPVMDAPRMNLPELIQGV
jgi:hypothetical protein